MSGNGQSNHWYYELEEVATALQHEPVALGEVRLTERFRLLPGSLLDVGCGSGRLDALLSRGDFVGVDYSRVQLNAYCGRYPGTRLIRATATALPFQDQCFDVVLLSFHLIEALLPRGDRQRALMEASRVAKPGGAIFLTRHCRLTYRVWDQIRDFTMRRGSDFGDVTVSGRSYSGTNDLSGYQMHIHSKREMRNLARSASLDFIESWDFDTGRQTRLRSRAVVEHYRAGEKRYQL